MAAAVKGAAVADTPAKAAASGKGAASEVDHDDSPILYKDDSKLREVNDVRFVRSGFSCGSSSDLLLWSAMLRVTYPADHCIS